MLVGFLLAVLPTEELYIRQLKWSVSVLVFNSLYLSRSLLQMCNWATLGILLMMFLLSLWHFSLYLASCSTLDSWECTPIVPVKTNELSWGKPGCEAFPQYFLYFFPCYSLATLLMADTLNYQERDCQQSIYFLRNYKFILKDTKQVD